jgi:hypothetical protein
VLLKTQSKEEYEAAKLQAQQTKFLGGVWRKTENELIQHSMHYETTRIGSYADFESMEFYPEIAAALDIMMEESTTVNNKGRVLNVYSDSKRIQGILEDLFFNRLDLHASLPMWTRNICKYGDNFLLLNIDDKKGIIGARQLPNFEIERREGDIVQKGEILAQLDQTRFASNVGESKSLLTSAQATAARLRAEVNGTPLAFPAEVLKEPKLVKEETALYYSRRENLEQSLADVVDWSLNNPKWIGL